MMNSVLSTDGFYFCTDYDLTHTLQRLANTSPDFQEMSLLERVRRYKILASPSIPTTPPKKNKTTWAIAKTMCSYK